MGLHGWLPGGADPAARGEAGAAAGGRPGRDGSLCVARQHSLLDGGGELVHGHGVERAVVVAGDGVEIAVADAPAHAIGLVRGDQESGRIGRQGGVEARRLWP